MTNQIRLANFDLIGLHVILLFRFGLDRARRLHFLTDLLR
jgi:hypothetical protein